MDQSDFSQFAAKYLALFLDPGADPDTIAAHFEEHCRGLGLESGALSGNLGTQLADSEGASAQISSAMDAALLGSTIYVRWKNLSSLQELRPGSKDRAWFTAAFSRLAELTRETGETQIILFPEIGSLQHEIDRLHEELEEVLARKDELVYIVVPNLDAQYRVLFGALEYEIYRTHCLVRRLRRKISLVRSRLNRQEYVDDTAIEAQLNTEFAQYEAALEEELARYTAAVDRWCAPVLSDKDTDRLKKLYRQAVKALHPDLNPNQPESRLALLQQAIRAYESGDLALMEGIALAVEGGEGTSSRRTSLQALRDEKKRLLSCIKATRRSIERIESEYPCSEREMMLDEARTAQKREELAASLASLQDQAASCTAQLKEMQREAR